MKGAMQVRNRCILHVPVPLQGYTYTKPLILATNS